MESLLQVVKNVLVAISSFLNFELFTEIVDLFPTTLYKARKIVGINRDDFDKYVVCSKCDSIYDYDDAYIMKNGVYFLIEQGYFDNILLMLFDNILFSSTYIPLAFVVKRFVYCKEEILKIPYLNNVQSFDTFNVVIPLPSKSIIWYWYLYLFLYLI